MNHQGPRRRAVFVSPLVPHPPVSGGQKRTLRLMEAAERAGALPHLLTADTAAPSESAAALRERGWGVDVVPEPAAGLRARAGQHARRRPSPFLTGVAGRLGELAAGTAFVQLEHTQSGYYRLPGVPSVLSLQNDDSAMARAGARLLPPLSGGWLREHNRAAALASVERAAVPTAELVLVVSEADAEAVRRRGGRALLVPNGVDEDLFAVAAPPPENRRALFFGHFGYAPNAEGLLRFAIEGWPRALAAQPAAELAVAGAGLDAELRARLSGLPGVVVLGLVPSIADTLAAAAVAVVPLWRGGGTRLKVVEAMAAGRPVVGTAFGVGGVGFADGTHGVVAEDPAAMGDAVGALLADGPGRAAMGEAARRHAERFAWSRVTAELVGRYRALLVR